MQITFIQVCKNSLNATIEPKLGETNVYYGHFTVLGVKPIAPSRTIVHNKIRAGLEKQLGMCHSEKALLLENIHRGPEKYSYLMIYGYFSRYSC